MSEITKSEKIAKQKEFIETLFIKDIGTLVASGQTLFAFMIIAQAIEVLGGFLDRKPMKAERQSAKRFSKALNLLFGKRYRAVNGDHKLYLSLRNQLTHSFIPSSELLLVTKATLPLGKQHLDRDGGQLILVLEDLYKDLVKGCSMLTMLLDKEEVYPTMVGDYISSDKS